MLHRACHLAVLWRWLAENPCDRVLVPTYAASRKEVWTPDELRRFLDGTRDDALYPLWLLLVTAGTRLGEASALRFS
ncbi:MAG: hypothetical protein HYY04_01105 [Chloroflexi bacterium]|nr:hypothetical protein [Chloroflexota bacterium]